MKRCTSRLSRVGKESIEKIKNMTSELNPINWSIVRRFAKKPVEDGIPDPILGAVDARYSMVDLSTKKRYVVTYRTETAGTPQVAKLKKERMNNLTT